MDTYEQEGYIKLMIVVATGKEQGLQAWVASGVMGWGLV